MSSPQLSAFQVSLGRKIVFLVFLIWAGSLGAFTVFVADHRERCRHVVTLLAQLMQKWIRTPFASQQYTWEEIEVATLTGSFLVIIVAVAFTAFFMKKRLIFLAGCFGSITGCSLTGLLLSLAWSTGAPLDNLDWVANSLLFNSAIFATLAIVAATVSPALYRQFLNWYRFQYSLRALLVVVTVACILASLVRVLFG